MEVMVKVCGLATPQDADAVSALGPDAVGFIFWEGSPRAVDPDQVGQWETAGPRPIRRVGVFVDATADDIRTAAEVARLDVIQLHGPVKADPKVFAGDPWEVWKVLHLDKVVGEDWKNQAVDAFLLDSSQGRMPGGTGQPVDWVAAASFVDRCPVQVILAGGLDGDNAQQALNQVRPWGVDASSRLEVEPGRKDLEKVKRYITSCRRY